MKTPASTRTKTTKRPEPEPAFNDLPPGARDKLQVLRNGVVYGRNIPCPAAEALAFIIDAIASDLGVTLHRAEQPYAAVGAGERSAGLA